MRVLLLLLLLLPVLAISGDSPFNDDVLGLIVFKADITDSHSNLASWNEDDDDPCHWSGVRCDPRTNRVTDLLLPSLSLSGRIGRGLLQLQSLRTLTLSHNNFSGSLHPDLLQLQSLRSVDLSSNSLSGPIPHSFFSQCRSIRSISLASNLLSGEIPPTVGDCSTLALLNLSSNMLSGGIPPETWKLNAVRTLDFSVNTLSGVVPVGISKMYNLRGIFLRGNKLSGGLPGDIGGCLLLRTLDFSGNALSGSLPESMRNLSLLGYLSLSLNSFTGQLPAWVSEMTNLKELDLSSNGFSGELPGWFGNLPVLSKLNLSRNDIVGTLPESMAAASGSLLDVDISWNLLTGGLPSWPFELGVERFSVSGNRLSGTIKVPATTATALRFMDLSGNGFSGEIPVEISSLYRLEVLNLSMNSISGSIPKKIGEFKLLEAVDVSGNRLNGSIPPEIGGATSLKVLKMDHNSLVGEIPAHIGNCSSLTSLHLSHNELTGPIPTTLANLTNLETVDLSMNMLTGTIPKQLGDLPHLSLFNISHNLLSGELPAGNFFNAIVPSSLSGNSALCGSILNRSCPTVLPKPLVLNPNSSSSRPSSGAALTSEDSRHKKIILSISALIAIGAAATIVIGVLTITVLNHRVQSSASRSGAAFGLSNDYLSQSPTSDANSGKLVMFSGDDPAFSAGAHALLNKDCELGRGGFGAVYKTLLRDGRPVAIKKLTVSSMVKSQEEFEREVKKLGNVGHPNLVALEGYYWTPSLQLLIYEFVSGGNLHKHLHETSASGSLQWQERFDIILGVARSLAHLHHQNIIHYNLKSSNVLIDGCGEPKVGDYGLANLLPMLDRYVLSSKIQSALGYMAPEFACRTVKITDKCDVYGFGVLVLEIVTGKRPVEYMEDDVVMLCDTVRGTLEEGRVEECVDEMLCGKFPVEEAVPVMKLGLICTSQVPSNRPNMAEVVSILELIRCPQDRPEEELG